MGPVHGSSECEIVEEQQKIIKALESDVDNRKSESQKWIKKFEDLEKEKIAIEKTLTNQLQNNNLLQKEKNVLRDQYVEIEKRYKVTKTDCENLQADLRNQKQNNAELREKLANLNIANTHLQEKLRLSSEAKTSMEKQLEKKILEIKKLKTNEQELQSTLFALVRKEKEKYEMCQSEIKRFCENVADCVDDEDAAEFIPSLETLESIKQKVEDALSKKDAELQKHKQNIATLKHEMKANEIKLRNEISFYEKKLKKVLKKQNEEVEEVVKARKLYKAVANIYGLNLIPVADQGIQFGATKNVRKHAPQRSVLVQNNSQVCSIPKAKKCESMNKSPESSLISTVEDKEPVTVAPKILTGCKTSCIAQTANHSRQTVSIDPVSEANNLDCSDKSDNGNVCATNSSFQVKSEKSGESIISKPTVPKEQTVPNKAQQIVQKFSSLYKIEQKGGCAQRKGKLLQILQRRVHRAKANYTVRGYCVCCCGMKFLTKRALHRHVHHFNYGLKFSCKRCSAKFLLLSYLKKHMQRAHQISNPYSGYLTGCRFCGKKMITRKELYRHWRETR